MDNIWGADLVDQQLRSKYICNKYSWITPLEN